MADRTLDELVSLVRRLAESDPVEDDEYWGPRCFFCGASWSRTKAWRGVEAPCDHADTCLWQDAQKYVGE